MDSVSVTLYVFFEDPFFVGVFEQVCEAELTACRTVFGAEPKDAEVYEFILREYGRLKPSPAVEARPRQRAMNPKRAKREADRHLAREGIGTKSQQALGLMRQEQGEQKKLRCREQRDARADRLFALKQQKRKEKHRGR